MSRTVGAVLGSLTVVVVVGAVAGAPLPVPDAPVLDKATLAKVRKLQEERRDVLRDSVRLNLLRIRGGQGTPYEVVVVACRLLDAELALADNRAGRLAAHQRHFATLKAM